MAKATDTDGLLRNAFDRQLICLMKERWWVGGKNAKTVGYIERRLREMSYMGQMPFDMVLRNAAQDLIEFGNFFLYLHRDAAKSSGQRTTVRGKLKDPIAAVHPVDPTTIYPKMGDTMEVRSWHQILDGAPTGGYSTFSGRGSHVGTQGRSTKRISPEDIIHGFGIRRRTGYVFGTPPVVPVLDDVLALRRLEEVAELIAHKHAFPLIHIQVGTEKQPARIVGNNQSEVALVEGQYRQIPLEGAFVTSERVNVAGVSADPMDLEKLLNHFKSRIIAGLGLSDVDMGQSSSANRGTAIVMSRSLMDRCRDYQQILSLFFTFNLLDVLLLEGGFNPGDPNDRVFLKFPQVDVERMMETNNHALALYQGDSINETEMREMMGLDPISDEQRKEMHLERVAMPLAKAKFEAQLQASVNSTSNSNQPTNQSGTKKARTTPANDETPIMLNPAADLLDCLQEIMVEYVEERVRAGLSVDNRMLQRYVTEAREPLRDLLMEWAIPHIKGGFQRYKDDSRSGRTFTVGTPFRNRFARHCLGPIVDRMLGVESEAGELDRLINRLRVCTDGRYSVKIVSFFDGWGFTWQHILDRLVNVAERFGYVQAAWSDGAHEVAWNFTDKPCRRCEDHQKVLAPTQASYYNLIDRDCVAEVRILDTNRLPNRVKFDVTKVTRTERGMQLQVDAPDRPGALTLTGESRFLRVLLDRGEQAMLPGEATDGWRYEGSGIINVPRRESGVVEFWDSGRVVGRARFTAPNGGVNGHSQKS
jgi:hypothetical protein